MLRLLSDEDVQGDVLRGLLLRDPKLDVVDARGVGLGHTPDPIILEWAASQGRVLLTGDLRTMVGFAISRVQVGLPMPGVLALLVNRGIGRVLDDILLAVNCYTVDDVDNQIIYIPF